MIPALELVDAIPQLRAVDDDLDRRRRVDQRVLEPLELLRAEHRLVRAVQQLVRRPIVTIVQQKNVDIAEACAAKDPRRSRKAVARIRPVAAKQRERFAFHRVRQIGVVRSVIVIVPDRDVRGSRQQRLERCERALAAIARCHLRRIELVLWLEIQVVAHPHHRVGFLCRDRIENLVTAAIVLRVPDRICIGQEEARADRDRDVLRIGGPGPARLCA